MPMCDMPKLLSFLTTHPSRGGRLSCSLLGEHRTWMQAGGTEIKALREQVWAFACMPKCRKDKVPSQEDTLLTVSSQNFPLLMQICL